MFKCILYFFLKKRCKISIIKYVCIVKLVLYNLNVELGLRKENILIIFNIIIVINIKLVLKMYFDFEKDIENYILFRN